MLLQYIMDELRRQGVRQFPRLRFVKLLKAGKRRLSGYTELSLDEIVVSAGTVDRLLNAGYPRDFVRWYMTFVIFHELKHFKDLAQLKTAGEVMEYARRYADDMVFRAKVEKEATRFGIGWANRIAEEKRWRVPRELRSPEFLRKLFGYPIEL